LQTGWIWDNAWYRIKSLQEAGTFFRIFRLYQDGEHKAFA
jgi:hypothetical protein